MSCEFSAHSNACFHTGVLPAAFEQMPLVNLMRQHRVWPAGTVADGRLCASNSHAVIQVQPHAEFRPHSSIQVYVVRSLKLAKEMLGTVALREFNSPRGLGAVSEVEAPLIIKFNENSEKLELMVKLKCTLDGREVKQRRGFGGAVLQ